MNSYTVDFLVIESFERIYGGRGSHHKLEKVCKSYVLIVNICMK